MILKAQRKPESLLVLLTTYCPLLAGFLHSSAGQMQLRPTATPAPTEVSPAEVVEQFTKATDAFNNLGVFMAVLFVMTLALLVILFIFWMNRNSTSTALNLISNVAIQKDKEIADLKAERAEKHEEHIESLSAIHDQMQRGNDLFSRSHDILIAVNDRGKERDAREERMAGDLNTLIREGSAPLREVLRSVQETALKVAAIDTRTADWQSILPLITPLLIELNALRLEAKRHDTQTVPAIQIDPSSPTLESP